MISCYYLFRALSPEPKYPKTPIALALNGIKYDLPLTPPVGESLIGLLSTRGPFSRLESLCNPAGICELRSNSRSFEPERGLPTYAAASQLIEIDDGERVMGYVLHQAITSKLGAIELSRFAVETALTTAMVGSLDGAFTANKEAVDWLMENSLFLFYSGGFEVARVPYFFNAAEKGVVQSSLREIEDDAEPPNDEPDNLGIFREMLEVCR